MKAWLASALLFSALAIAPAANAAVKEPPRTEWYGWQILASDATTLVTSTLLLGSLRNENYGLVNLYGGFVLGGPIVHGVHGNPGRALGSLALRVVLPTAGGLIGCAAYDGHNEFFGCLPGAALGLAIGMGGAIALDSGVLGYTDGKPEPRTLGVVPSASFSRTGATFGLQGIF